MGNDHLCGEVEFMKAFLLFFSLALSQTYGQPVDENFVVEDLRSEWMIFEDGSFSIFDDSWTTPQTIYFELDPGRYFGNAKLHIQAAVPFSLYVNYKFSGHHSSLLQLNLDSLKNIQSGDWLFSIHRKEGLSWLETKIVADQPQVKSDLNSLRVNNPFKNFSIIAAIILVIFFTILLRTNPKLTVDYFNFVRLFSIQEREDTLLNSRISSSVNILFYFFSSVLCGFILLTIFHFGSSHISIAEQFRINSLGQAFIQWGILSFYIAVLFVSRLLVLMVIGWLFNARDVLGIQFYNFIRLSLFTLTTSALVCLVYFMIRIRNPEYFEILLSGIIVLLIFWMLLIGLKLMGRTPFQFFHLFSYLCASEIIPIVILVKVLNS